MFGLGGKEKILDKARRLTIAGKPEKALEVLQGALTGDDSDLPLILEIMHIYSSMSHFKEVIIWAKKGESISRDTKSHIVKEVEDLYYGSNKPAELGEYLIEKRTEARDFEGVWEIIESMEKDRIAEIIQRENSILANVRVKEKLGPRDKLHYYMTALCYEHLDTQRSMAVFMELLKKAPEEEETIYNEIERVNRTLFGDPYIMITLGRLLLRRGNLERGLEQFRKATDRSEKVIPYALPILEEFSEKIPETLDLLSDLYIKIGDKNKALEVLNKFRGKAAINKYEELVRKNPDSIEALKKLSLAYWEERRYLDAMKTLRKAMDVDSTSVKLEELNSLVEKIPDDADALFVASDIYKKLNEHELAVSALEKAYRISPSSIDEILDLLKDIISEKPDMVKGVVFKAELLANRKEFDNAIDTIETVLDSPEGIELAKQVLLKIYEKNPENSKSAILVNIINLSTNTEQAIENLNRIISEEPGAIPYLMKQMDTWIRMKPDYIPYALKAYYSFPPENFPPFVLPFAIAEALALSGDFEKAKEYYIKAVKQEPSRANLIIKSIRNHPESPENFLLLIEILLLFKQFQRAEEVIQTVIKKYPDITQKLVTILLTSIEKVGKSPGIYSILLNLLNQHGYYDEVIKYGHIAEEMIPRGGRGNLYFNMANAYARIGKEEDFVKYLALAVAEDKSLNREAIELIEGPLEERDVGAETYLLLHSLYREEKDIKKSADVLYKAYNKNPGIVDAIIEDFHKLIDIAPIEASLYLRLGQILLQKGDEKGFEYLQKAVRFDPKLNDSVVEALDSVKGTPLEQNAAILKLELLKSAGKYNEALASLVSLYQSFPESRQKFINDILTILPRVEITPENYREILKVIIEEKRNRLIIDFVNKLIEKYPGLSNDILNLLDEHYGDEYPVPLSLLKAKLLKISGKSHEYVDVLLNIFNEAPDSAGAILDLLEVNSPETARLFIECSIKMGRYEDAFEKLEYLSNEDKLYYLQELVRYSDKREFREELIKNYAIVGHWDKILELGEGIVEPDEKVRALLYLAGKDIHVDYGVLLEVKREILKERMKGSKTPEERYNLALKIGDENLIKDSLEELPEEMKRRETARYEMKKGRYLTALKLLRDLNKDEDILRMMMVCASKLGMRNLYREARTALASRGKVVESGEAFKEGWKMIKPISGR